VSPHKVRETCTDHVWRNQYCATGEWMFGRKDYLLVKYGRITFSIRNIGQNIAYKNEAILLFLWGDSISWKYMHSGLSFMGKYIHKATVQLTKVNLWSWFLRCRQRYGKLVGTVGVVIGHGIRFETSRESPLCVSYGCFFEALPYCIPYLYVSDPNTSMVGPLSDRDHELVLIRYDQQELIYHFLFFV